MSDVLTARQSEIWSLRHEKKLTFRKVAEAAGCTISSAQKTLKLAEKKLGPDKDKLPALASPMERMAAKFEEIARFLADATDQTKIRLVDDRIIRALGYLDDQALAQATATQLTNVITGLTNVGQLLKGEPTAITKFQDMRNMDELMDMFRKEAARRERLAPAGAG